MNLTNENGGVIAGDYLQLNTANDLTNKALIKAGSAASLEVGGNFNNQSDTYSTSSTKGLSSGSRTDISQLATIYVGETLKGQTDKQGNSLITFNANVGGNTTFDAGVLDNQGGSTRINTAGDTNLNAVNTGYQTNAIGDDNNYFKQGETKDIGSQITGADNIIITSGGDFTGKAVTINSDNGTVGLQAGNDITIDEGRHTQNLSTANKTTDRGFLSKTTTQSRFDSQSDTAISSNIEGNKVIMDAGNDVNLTATNAISDKGTSIKAGNNVNILAAQNTSSTSSENSTKKSGVFSSGGLGFTIGKQKTENDNTQTALTHTASNIGAIDGNVSIEAGNHIQQTGSNVIAGIGDRQSVDSSDTERGNVVYRAKAVDIDNAMDKYTNQSEQKLKQSGLTVTVSNSLVDSAQNIDRLIDAAGNTSSQRMKGLAAISAGLKAEALYGEGKQAAKALQTGNLKDVGNTRIQATIGSSKSQSNSQSYSEQSQGSSIQAANNLAIIATGAGKDSNININASDITVGNNALFKTDNDLNIKGVAQNEQTRSNNKSSSFGIGAYASTNPGKEGASFGITANASGAKGHANSDGTTYANSHIDVGNTTTLDIGNDMNVKGGVLTTDKLTGQVAGDLNMESLQDTYVYDSKQKNAGFSADIDLSGNAQANSLSINGGKTNIDADYAAVTEQTAIYTQKADLNVGGKGVIKGAAYTTASADDNKTVFAQGIETSDIQNHSNYDAKAIAAGISIGKAKDTNPEASLNGIGYGTDSDNQSSTTKAAVTGRAGESQVTTATKDSLNEPLENSFDASTVNEELGAQVEITRAFGTEAPKAVAEFSQKRIDDIKADPNLSIDEKLAEIEKWDEGGAYRVAAHTAIGALGTGNLEGSLTTGSVAAAAPKISEYESKLADALVSSGMSPEAANATSKGVTTFTLAGIGANAGLNTSSTVTAVNVDSNNRWLHDSEVLNIFKHKKDIENFAKENGITYKQAYRAILAQAYRNTDDDFRKAHSPKPGTKESSLAQKAENFLRKHVLIASTASERKNHNLNRNSTKYKGLLSGVERKTPAYSQTNKNIQVLKGVGKITAEGTVKGVGNIPSDTANGVAQIFGGKYERSFPYDSPESEEVGSVAQNVVGVATTVAGIKYQVSRSTNTAKLPSTREQLRADLERQGFYTTGTSAGGYEVWKKTDPAGQIKVDIKPTGEVIRSQKVWNSERTKKYNERQDYFGNRLEDQSHSTGHFVE